MECSNGGQTTEFPDAPRLLGHQARRPRRLWLNLGLVFPHKDGSGFNIILQALPLDGKIVCREIAEDDAAEPAAQPRGRQEASRGGQGGRRR
jgi:hypothetical protein